MRVLDIMDETVGGLGLVLTATLIAVTFTWFMEGGDLAEEMGRGRRVALPIAKYAVPAVMAMTLLAWALL